MFNATHGDKLSMPRAGIGKGAMFIALSLALGACSKQEEPAATPTPQASNPAPLSAADCDRMPDPAPANDSAAGRSTAVSQGVAARAACKRAASAPESNADLARMRQIMEKQEADKASQKISNEEWARRVKEAGKAPAEKLKY